MADITQITSVTVGLNAQQVRVVKASKANDNAQQPVKDVNKVDGAPVKVKSGPSDAAATTSTGRNVTHYGVISPNADSVGGFFKKMTPSQVLRTYNSAGAIDTKK